MKEGLPLGDSMKEVYFLRFLPAAKERYFFAGVVLWELGGQSGENNAVMMLAGITGYPDSKCFPALDTDHKHWYLEMGIFYGFTRERYIGTRLLFLFVSFSLSICPSPCSK